MVRDLLYRDNFEREIMKKLVLAAALAVMPFGLAHAKGEVEFGYSMTDGNSDTQKLNAGLGLVNTFGQWRNNFLLTANTDKSDNDRTSEKYAIVDKIDRILSPRSYVFGRISHETDKFSSYDEQSSLAAGYGYQFIKSQTVDLKAEVGPGYSLDNFTTEPGTEGYAVAYLGETFNWKFSPNASFEQGLNVLAGSDNTKVGLGVALKSALTKALALKVYAKADWNEEVADGFEHTDTETGVSINYNF